METAEKFFLIFVKEFVFLFTEMAPFLLLGFLLAGIIHVWIPKALYIPKLSKPSLKSSLWAALFGIPLPICSCGVIPTAIALKKEGASKGACVSFLISTPATGVDSILATYSLLGLPFAIIRPFIAFITALFGGFFTNIFTANESDKKADTISIEHKTHSSNSCCSCSCKKKTPRTFKEKCSETFRYGFLEMVSEISKWLLIGILLGALIETFIPNDFFIGLREYPFLCSLGVLLLAMPMYTCATGSIPLALVLIAKGISPGAALVLLMAGPATSFSSMFIIGKHFGKRTLITYLFTIASGALFFGFLIDTFFMDTFSKSLNPFLTENIAGNHYPGIFSFTMSFILASLMIYSKIRKKKKGNG